MRCLRNSCPLLFSLKASNSLLPCSRHLAFMAESCPLQSLWRTAQFSQIKFRLKKQTKAVVCTRVTASACILGSPSPTAPAALPAAAHIGWASSPPCARNISPLRWGNGVPLGWEIPPGSGTKELAQKLGNARLRMFEKLCWLSWTWFVRWSF